MLNGLDLFSGIGAMSLGLQRYVRPVIYCDKDKFAQQVLQNNIKKGVLKEAPVIKDVKLVNRKTVRPIPIDIIYGGFPCQDVSIIGKRVGITGERSGLIEEVYRLIRTFEPTYVFLENVQHILSNGHSEIVAKFHSLGYDTQWDIVSAEMFGAPHIRKRWFLLAKKRGRKADPKCGNRFSSKAKNVRCTNETLQAEKVFNASSGKCSTSKMRHRSVRSGSANPTKIHKWEAQEWFSSEPQIPRMAHGDSNTVHELTALGNSVVPICVKYVFLRLMLCAQFAPISMVNNVEIRARVEKPMRSP